VITTPEKSWEAHEQMIKTSEEFMQSVRKETEKERKKER
jgi:seryl-tRNA synthetase